MPSILTRIVAKLFHLGPIELCAVCLHPKSLVWRGDSPDRKTAAELEAEKLAENERILGKRDSK